MSLPAEIVLLKTSGSMSLLTAVGCGVLMLAAGVGILWLVGLPGRMKFRRLHDSTQFGRAYVKNVTAKYVTTRGPRYVQYDVIITPPDGPPYDASTDVIATAVDLPASLRVGQTFDVQIDPKNPKNFRFTFTHDAYGRT